MKLDGSVGILAYGTHLPLQMITAEEIGRAHGSDGSQGRQLGVKQKTVAAIDEDTITLATLAGYAALQNWMNGQQKSPRLADIQTLFIGSESHPYAVKPSGTVVKEALGLSDQLAMADLQFACKAGTQSLQIALSYVHSGMAKIGLAIGADTAQSKPGDVLEFTAAAGAAAYLMAKDSKDTHVIARCLGTLSIATDTPDFWRRPGQAYPQHAGRFSGEPGYFAHVKQAAKALMTEMKLTPADFGWCVFHTPNAKFPKTVAQQLGFSAEQLAPALVVSEVGNTYAAASLLALAAVLDQAQPNQKILVVSYGSGSGSDAFVFETTAAISTYQQRQTATLRQHIARLQPITYQEYQRSHVGKH